MLGRSPGCGRPQELVQALAFDCQILPLFNASSVDLLLYCESLDKGSLDVHKAADPLFFV